MKAFHKQKSISEDASEESVRQSNRLIIANVAFGRGKEQD
jgi:hypothetical protein